ncbi:azurin [Franzmannia pantelleriensis]|uniref:Azurin n=1 Tax=Franzmannia pantelleriensis TaxID=48727 RepID=A0A1G9JRN3_9GAMM|nr:azurin [Halomonas pantelleriensis]SDL39946.1 azurin [Halomonas pantelleriensis]
MIRPMVAAALLGLLSLPALADECSAVVESNDQMQFDTDTLEISQSCDTFTLELEHVGSMGVETMGHNWVLTREADMADVAEASMAAGPENDYIVPDDERIIAYTEMIGGGESTSVTFDVDELDGDDSYVFFCSFPGHSGIMRGAVTLVD